VSGVVRSWETARRIEVFSDSLARSASTRACSARNRSRSYARATRRATDSSVSWSARVSWTTRCPTTRPSTTTDRRAFRHPVRGGPRPGPRNRNPLEEALDLEVLRVADPGVRRGLAGAAGAQDETAAARSDRPEGPADGGVESSRLRAGGEQVDAELVERRDLPLAAFGLGGPFPLAGHQPARDRRRDEEAGEGHPVLRVGDVQRAEGRQEEVIESDGGQKRRGEARGEPSPDRDREHRHEEDESGRDRVGAGRPADQSRGADDERRRGERAEETGKGDHSSAMVSRRVTPFASATASVPGRSLRGCRPRSRGRGRRAPPSRDRPGAARTALVRRKRRGSESRAPSPGCRRERVSREHDRRRVGFPDAIEGESRCRRRGPGADSRRDSGGRMEMPLPQTASRDPKHDRAGETP